MFFSRLGGRISAQVSTPQTSFLMCSLPVVTLRGHLPAELAGEYFLLQFVLLILDVIINFWLKFKLWLMKAHLVFVSVSFFWKINE